MSPILSLAVGGLRGSDMAQAVGLANMVRQLGGAFGIALINLYLIHLNSQIRGNMLGYINIYDTQSADRLTSLTQNYVDKGWSFDEATSLAYRALEGMLFKQQALVAYNHGFMVIGLTILLAIPIVLLLRYKKTAKAADLSGAH
jgi:DHA2 family multidrug resistance protein